MAKSKVFRLIYRQLVKWFVNSVWPWVVENLWPEIKQLLMTIFVEVLDKIRAIIFEWINSHRKRREENARKKAAEAEQAAQTSQNESEAEKHRAVAQVWREVAEQFRQENDELKEKLNEVLKKAASDFGDKLEDLDLKDIIQEGVDGNLQIKGSGTPLQLPEPSDKS